MCDVQPPSLGAQMRDSIGVCTHMYLHQQIFPQTYSRENK